MVRQALQLLGERRDFNGYMEIGSTGRYVAGLRANLKLHGPLILLNDIAPTNSPIDIVERGGLRKVGKFVPLADYAPIDSQAVPDASLDFVSCYIGLHHIHPSRLEGFIQSIRRVLRPGGVFILRDHDVRTPEMFKFVSLVHTVFNAGLGVPWETNQQELRHFAPVSDWVQRLRAVGLVDSGKRLLQANDPSDNVLMSFVREG